MIGTIARISSVIILGFLLSRCGQTDKEGSELDSASTALSITGQWQMVSYKGSYIEGVGTGVSRDVPFSRTFDESQYNTISTYNIAANGEGWIKGKQTCKPNLPIPTDGPASIRQSKILNVIEGVVGLITAIIDFQKIVGCQAGVLEEATVYLSKRRGTIFIGADHLSANIGVMSEPPANADVECNRLRGVRYVKIDQADACIGYNNAEATELKMMIQRWGEIYVQRVILRRP